MRRLYALPRWCLVLLAGSRMTPRRLACEAYVELWFRADEADYAEDEFGPYLVSPPEGIN
jgi:hypothetical protein